VKGEEKLGSTRILVADTDCALFGLLSEWLAACGCVLAGACGPDEDAHERYDVIVVDVPFPRQGGLDVLKDLAREHPHTPIVAISANFLPGVEASGAVARELGVSSVLAKPVNRDALIAAVQQAALRR
jgi:CheY-like chemotaxis protein